MWPKSNISFSNESPRIGRLWMRLIASPLSFLLPVIVAWLNPSFGADQDLPIKTVIHDSDDADSGITQIMASDETAWTKSKHFLIGRDFLHDHTVWTRSLIPKSLLGERLVAVIDLPISRTSDFYLVENGQIIEHGRSSLDPPPQELDHLGTATVFKLRAGQVDRELYVRQATPTLNGAPLYFRTEDAQVDHERQREIALGLIGGIAFGLALYHLFLFAMTGERLYFQYAGFLMMCLVTISFLSGLLPETLRHFGFSLNQSMTVTIECILLMSIAISEFEDRMIELESGVTAPTRKASRTFTLALLGEMALVPFIHIALAILVLAAIAIVTVQWKQFKVAKKLSTEKGSRYYLVQGIYLSGWLVTMAALADWIEPSFTRLFMFSFASIAASIIFSSFLGRKLRHLEQERMDLINKLTKNPKVALDSQLHTGQPPPTLMETADVCIMFVDIVAFSQVAAPLPSREVFAQLSRRIVLMTDIVHDFGGVIDRSLGDGILCFFPKKDGDTPGQHSLRAFQAASRIQQAIVAIALRSSDKEQNNLVMPVRIGVHTTRVVIGNLGGQHRVDFTMIGAGVNFASRLETACTPFRVIVSEECLQDLKACQVNTDSFNPIAVAVKHQTALVRAYEFNPFVGKEETLKAARLRYFAQLGVEAKDRRVAIVDPANIVLQSSEGDLIVTDISENGLKVHNKRLFGQRSLLTVRLVTADEDLNRKLASKLLDRFTVEVRWGIASGDGYDHGLRVFGGNVKQRQYIFDALSGRYGEKSRPPERLGRA